VWRGGSAKCGYIREQADLALGVRLSFVRFVPLQVSVVKLQRLNNEIRLLSFGNGFRNELGYPFIWNYRTTVLIIKDFGMSLVIRSSRKTGFSFWFGFSSSIMDWITSSVSFPSWLNFFILIACANEGVASL